jgi:heme exporter protein D
MRRGPILLLVGSDVWLASAVGLIGVALGGLVSLAVSRQQIREAREQRADEASRERYRLSVDRRFRAYSEFITNHRSVQNALQFYYSQADDRPALSDINTLLRSARDSAAMVFLVVEKERTYEACRGVLRALGETQSVVTDNNGEPDTDSWRKVNTTLGRAMREFQNASRAELEVNGPEWPWVERQPPTSPKTVE